MEKYSATIKKLVNDIWEFSRDELSVYRAVPKVRHKQILEIVLVDWIHTKTITTILSANRLDLPHCN